MMPWRPTSRRRRAQRRALLETVAFLILFALWLYVVLHATNGIPSTHA